MGATKKAREQAQSEASAREIVADAAIRKATSIVVSAKAELERGGTVAEPPQRGRRMNGRAWAGLTFLTSVVGLAVYMKLRKPRKGG